MLIEFTVCVIFIPSPSLLFSKRKGIKPLLLCIIASAFHYKESWIASPWPLSALPCQSCACLFAWGCHEAAAENWQPKGYNLSCRAHNVFAFRKRMKNWIVISFMLILSWWVDIYWLITWPHSNTSSRAMWTWNAMFWTIFCLVVCLFAEKSLLESLDYALGLDSWTCCCRYCQSQA